LTDGIAGEFTESMQLRHHPLMSHGGVHNWQPTWVKSGGLRNVALPTLRGAIGTLTEVLLPMMDRCMRCHLLIDFRDASYMGTLTSMTLHSAARYTIFCNSIAVNPFVKLAI
jgi:hypothetical protein